MKKIILVIAILAVFIQVSYPQVNRKLLGHTDYVNAVCYSPGGRFIASGGFDGTIKIWDTENGVVIKSINTKYKIYKLLFSGNSEQLIAGTVSLNGISSAIDSFIVSYDTRTGKQTDNFNVSSRSPDFYVNENSLITLAPDLLLDSCEYSYDYSLKKYSVKNCYKVILNGYNPADNSLINNIRLDKIHMWTFNSPWALSNDGKSLAVCPENTETQKQAAHNNNIDAKFNQDEAGNIIYFYDLDKKTLVNKVRIVNSYLREKNVLISNDCKYFYYTAIEYTDDVIKVLDINKDEEVKTLKGHEREILCTALHPGGRYLASGSRDNNVIIWDLHTGKSIKILEGHKDNVNYVSFSPNGRYLASASDDKNIIIWDLAKISNDIEAYAVNYDNEAGKEKYLKEEKLFQSK
jgi:WD40 repeat protein